MWVRSCGWGGVGVWCVCECLDVCVWSGVEGCGVCVVCVCGGGGGDVEAFVCVGVRVWVCGCVRVCMWVVLYVHIRGQFCHLGVSPPF